MIRQLARCIGQFKRDSLLTAGAVILEVIMDTIVPLLMADMIDNGITAGNMGHIGKTGLLLLIVCIISLVSGTLSGRFCSRAGAGFAQNLRQKMFYKIQDFSFTNVDRFSSNSLVTRLTTDVTNVQNAFQVILRICSRAPLMIVFSIIMAFRINSKLAWIFVAAIPVLGIGLMLIITTATPFFEKASKLYDSLNGVVQENIRGIRVVKSFVREDHEVQKFEKTSGNIFNTFVTAEKVVAFSNPLMQFCMYACTLLVCWLGAEMIVSDAFTTGQLMSLLTYATQILMSLMFLSTVFVMIAVSRASTTRIGEVLLEDTDMHNKEKPVYKMQEGSISFKNMSFGYKSKDGKQCLQDINIDIQAGQTIGIIGGTGSGKSSLVQLIPRLYDATHGSVEVGGIDVRDYDIQTLREQVAMVLQKNVLFAGTIRDNIRWGKKDASDEEIERACRFAQADEFIRAFPDGYDTWIEQGGSNVSGGQKQRICIARALIKAPKILILDDSTSAVDTKTDALIRKAFREQIPDTTKIIIAQRVSSIQDADQIIVMDNGRISAIGTHEQLLVTSSIYSEVYESQQKGGLDHGAA